MSSVSNGPSTASKNVIQIDEKQIRSHVEEVVRTSVDLADPIKRIEEKTP